MTKLKLNTLNKQNLDNREMNEVRGGGTPGDCCCGCVWAGTPGGSSYNANDAANDARGLKSPNCLGTVVVTPGGETPTGSM